MIFLNEPNLRRIYELIVRAVRKIIKNLREKRKKVGKYNPLVREIIVESLKDLEESSKFIAYSAIERSIVTSLGSLFENIAKVFENYEDSPYKDIIDQIKAKNRVDMVKVVDNTYYFIQVKSGPLTINRDIADETKQKLTNAVVSFLDSIDDSNIDADLFLGLCYGTDEDMMFHCEYVGLDYKIGDEFWSFISEGELTLSGLIWLFRETLRRENLSLSIRDEILGYLRQLGSELENG